jgi:hypothetical protein
LTKSRIVTIDSEADPLLNASCSALHLQFQPDDKLILQIVSIQQSIKRVLSDALFCCPPPSLHMTILTLIPARPELASQTGAAWVNAGRRWAKIIAEVCSTRSPINMKFDTVEISNRAIFLKSQQTTELQGLRSALVKQLAPLGLPIVAPDIAHISLFRFMRTVPDFQLEIPAALPEGAPTARVRTISLAKELRYPSLEPEHLARFQLGRGLIGTQPNADG